ncbi:hypothetical protein Slin15195_G130370 [Septoria linicola]|uniref:Uncharacterized protein n=1 Tax=Septoria linicola TaxID=215465 RepID=A0A9Q9ESL3_9PEZI|nr:hypothetical protein Slin15195_G130370 [Septoria linicola]
MAGGYLNEQAAQVRWLSRRSSDVATAWAHLLPNTDTERQWSFYASDGFKGVSTRRRYKMESEEAVNQGKRRIEGWRERWKNDIDETLRCDYRLDTSAISAGVLSQCYSSMYKPRYRQFHPTICVCASTVAFFLQQA